MSSDSNHDRGLFVKLRTTQIELDNLLFGTKPGGVRRLGAILGRWHRVHSETVLSDSWNVIKALPVRGALRGVKAICHLWHLQLHLLPCHLKLKRIYARKCIFQCFWINWQMEFAGNRYYLKKNIFLRNMESWHLLAKNKNTEGSENNQMGGWAKRGINRQQGACVLLGFHYGTRLRRVITVSSPQVTSFSWKVKMHKRLQPTQSVLIPLPLGASGPSGLKHSSPQPGPHLCLCCGAARTTSPATMSLGIDVPPSHPLNQWHRNVGMSITVPLQYVFYSIPRAFWGHCM